MENPTPPTNQTSDTNPPPATPPPEATPPATPPAGENKPWYEGESVPAEFVSDKVKTFTKENGEIDLPALLKSYGNAQHLIGKGIPDENSPEDVRNEFLKRLGRPDSAEGYEWKMEGVDPGVAAVESEHFKRFQERAFAAGLSKKQYAVVMDAWAAEVAVLNTRFREGIEATRKDSFESLSAQNAWGDKYEARKAAVYKAIDDMDTGTPEGQPTVKDALMMAGLYEDKRILKFIDSVVAGSKESTFVGGGRVDGSTIQSRLNELKANPAFMQAGHPEHDAVIAEYTELVRKRPNAP